MALFPYGGPDRLFRRAFENAWGDFDLAPYWNLVQPERALQIGDTIGEVTNTKDKFSIGVDVSQFKPEELKVNLTGRQLVIEGHHEEKNDRHGTIQRSFVRKFLLPEDTNVEGLQSNLSKDGKLTIEAPKKAIKGPQPKAIPIQRSSA